MPRLAEYICSQLTSDVISRCKTVNIFTVTDFITEDPEVLSKKISISYKDVMLIFNALLLKYSEVPQRADSLYYEMLETLAILNTGSKRVNRYLKGGIYTGEITEIHGPSGSGKTQFCFDVVSNLLLETGYTVLYIDTNCSFSARRVEEILTKKSLGCIDSSEKLKMIRVVNVCDVYNFLDIFDYVKDKLQKKKDPFFKYLKLLVIDSVTHILGPCFGGSYVSGLGMMGQIVQLFKILYTTYYLSIMVCNNTVQGNGTEVKSALGFNWKYVPSVSLCVQKIESKQYKMDSVKSCRSGLFKDVTFCIDETGLSD